MEEERRKANATFSPGTSPHASGPDPLQLTSPVGQPRVSSNCLVLGVLVASHLVVFVFVFSVHVCQSSVIAPRYLVQYWHFRYNCIFLFCSVVFFSFYSYAALSTPADDQVHSIDRPLGIISSLFRPFSSSPPRVESNSHPISSASLADASVHRCSTPPSTTTPPPPGVSVVEAAAGIHASADVGFDPSLYLTYSHACFSQQVFFSLHHKHTFTHTLACVSKSMPASISLPAPCVCACVRLVDMI